MRAHKSAKKRGPGGPLHTEPEPGLKLPKPGSECSTPELTSGLSRGLKALLRKLDRKPKDGAGDKGPK